MKIAQKSQKVYRSFIVLALLCAGVMPGLLPAGLPSAQAQDDLHVCAAHEFHIRGQIWETDGTYYGIQPNTPGSADLVDYQLLTQYFAEMTLGGNPSIIAPDRDVVLLIVDEYTHPSATLAHGYYTYEVANHTLMAARSRFNFPARMIIEDEVKVDFADVYDIIESLNAALTMYTDAGYSQFVVNMSFALMPCEYEDTGEQWDIPSKITLNYNDFKGVFDEYALEKQNYSLIQYVSDTLAVEEKIATEIVFDWIGSYAEATRDGDGSSQLDPLREYLQSGLPKGVEVLIPIAASGNYGNGIPAFAPASWPEVISVGSTRADYSANPGDEFRNLSVFSNVAGIVAPGEWHPILSSNERIAGTSFAAPVASVLAALLQSSSTINCDLSFWADDESSEAYFIDAFLSVCSP